MVSEVSVRTDPWNDWGSSVHLELIEENQSCIKKTHTKHPI